jgi:hypothetical protein
MEKGQREAGESDQQSCAISRDKGERGRRHREGEGRRKMEKGGSPGPNNLYSYHESWLAQQLPCLGHDGVQDMLSPKYFKLNKSDRSRKADL